MLNEKNKDILKCLLESILKVKIEDIEILNQERNSSNVKIKRKHLDAILKTNIGIIEIEVNSSDKSYVHPRNMSYLCDVYSHSVLVGKDYDEDKMFIQINLSYGLKDNKLQRIYKITDEDKHTYVKNFIIYEINMDMYKKIWYDKDKEKIEDNKYIIMLDLEKEDLLKLSNKDKVVSKYMADLEKVNEDYEFREYMSVEEDNRKIMNSLKKEYIKEGLEQGKIEIAKSMLNKGIALKIISECTGLTIEEIERLNN